MTDPIPFRVGFVPGVTLTKWSRVWAERHGDRPLEVTTLDPRDPTGPLTAGEVDVVFARLPIPEEGLHSIALYDEQPVAVLPKEHALVDRPSLVVADLDGEARFDLDPSLDPEMQVATVVTGAGVAVMPQSVARLYGRKGMAARPVTDLAATTIALVWTEGATTTEIDDFIGVVRGRTANSSRRRDADEPAEALGPVAKAKAKRAAAEAAAAKAAGPAKKGSGGKRRVPARGRGGAPKKGRR